jgi:hypothetical protein
MYFVIHECYSMHKYSEVDIKEMLGFLIENIFVVFGNKIFQQTVGITMGTNCVPLLADLFLYSYEQNSFKNFYIRIHLLLWPSIQHLDASTMFYRLNIYSFTSRSSIFHLYGDVAGEGLQNLGLCSALRPKIRPKKVLFPAS